MPSSSTSTPRLFTAHALHADASVVATEAQAHYLRQVMRRGDGDGVVLFNGRDGAWAAAMEARGKREAGFTVTRQLRAQDPLPPVTLAFAPLKGPHLDLVVEKATELGVGVLAPLLTARTIVTKVKDDRLRAVAIEAAEQCERTTVPEIRPAQRLRDFVTTLPAAAGTTVYFCDESAARDGKATSVTAAMRAASGPAVLVVGPEGGFTVEEAAVLRALPQATPIALGPRILRAETAALAVLACWQALAGDWR
jgi:16S rRNA (uracil1498-N3)-methyltransferase